MKAKKTKSAKTIIIVTAITTIIALVFSIAKYRTTMASNDTASIATPIINLSKDTINVSISPEDEPKEYIFSVTNYEDELVTETSMNYYIQITSIRRFTT